MNIFLVSIFAAALCLVLPSNSGFSKSPKVSNSSIESHLSEVISAFIQARILNRDSGKQVDLAFVKNCIKEKTETYLQIYCDDLLWPHHAVLLSEKYLYLVSDGGSVENRALFKLTGNSVVEVQDNLPKLLTFKKVTELLNARFPNLNMNVKRLEAIAHSHYRTRLPRDNNQTVRIYPGRLSEGSGNYSDSPIAKAVWTGKKFELQSL